MPKSLLSAHPQIARRWLEEIPIYVIAAGLLAACAAVLIWRGSDAGLVGITYSAQLFLIFMFFMDTVPQLWRHRPTSPLSFLWAHYNSPEMRSKALCGLPMLLIGIVLMPYFSKMKAAIPLFNEYTWDDAFIRWDQALFFGHDAWQVLQPIIGFPIITATLALLYQVWMLLLFPGVLFFIFGPVNSQLRRQFFLTYMLSWAVIGSAMATWLASVGPCFVGPLLGDTRFDAQMAYLNSANDQIPIMTLRVQDLLLEWHLNAQDGLGAGITAMPSMHCAIAFLYWLAMRRVSPRLGIVFAAFFLITWVSSVHLAYHYAVDGLVSLVAVAILWKIAQAIIAGWDHWLAGQATFRTNTVPAE